MRISRLLLPTLLLPLLLLPAPALAEIKITAAHNNLEDSTPEFKFKDAPSPVRGSASAKATLLLITGERDNSGGELAALTDGLLPSEADEPAANFFFRAATDGGRILVDLHNAINIKQISTYSWHTDARAPQVYTLYAADGSEKDFDAKPAKNIDPEKAGWKLLANVDTRDKQNKNPGGQYAASIADSAGEKNLGKFRYLLIAASPTEAKNPFANTFFSELNVIDADKPLDKVADVPNDAVKILTIEKGKEKYTVTLNSTEVPELTEWLNKDVATAVDAWYPKIVEMLPSDGYTAPKKFSITIRKNMDGVAYTAGTSVVCAAKYFLPRKGDVGAVVHELVHVVQQYKGRNNPGWLVEGLADQIRWFQYEPEAKRPRKPNPDKAKYTDSYQVTGGFLDYVVKTHDKDLIVKLNAAMRTGKYSPDLWKAYTTKTIDELWAEYIATIKK